MLGPKFLDVNMVTNVHVSMKHIWHCRFQFHSVFNKHHEFGINVCMNARDTARQCGQILSCYCCFDIFVM